MKEILIHIIAYGVSLSLLFISAIWIWASFADVYYRITGRPEKSPMRRLKS